MAIYTLTSSEEESAGTRLSRPLHGLGSGVLAHNLRWFVKVRWVVVAFFAATGLAATLAPGLIAASGFNPPTAWPWLLGAALAIANICFYFSARNIDENAPVSTAEHRIWAQIAFDLLIVTALVHFIGSTETFICFTYLFHIVLACVFLSPSRSFAVTLTASLLYLACVSLELTGIWPSHGIMPDGLIIQRAWHLSAAQAVSAVLVWFVVWGLVAFLSQIVAERTFQLEAANGRLRKADEEKNQIVLRTTHDLKAPFCGIESNIQILKYKHWNELNDKTKELILRIETRSHTLAQRIRDILALGALRSDEPHNMERGILNLKAVFDNIYLELEDRANARHVEVDMDIHPIVITGNHRLISMLFANLLANAIAYSREGGLVKIIARENNLKAVVTITDNGIGICEKDLPHIFDEYYRSHRAAEYNLESTGLGLAIVKEVAQKEDIQIQVTSIEETGTAFTVEIKKSLSASQANNNTGRYDHGKTNDN